MNPWDADVLQQTRAFALLCLTCAIVSGAAHSIPAQPPDLARQIATRRWIAYAPTNYNPEVRPPKLPPAGSIEADLIVLRRAGFDGLVTYSASLPEIVDTAEKVGFKAVLLGIWDPASDDEARLAQASARRDVVLGLICGNEGLMFRRYTAEVLKRGMEFLKKLTGKPISTTEVIESFYTKPELVEWSDFLTVNAHPYFHSKRIPREAVDWTIASWARLRDRIPDKPILFKEVGLPTAGERGLSESAQAQYYTLLLQTEVQFVFFEAFDTLFKRGAVEQSWGLFHADRTPKPAAKVLAAK
jgi:exo-beta-1,3-glucanase (GH17 family)